MTAADGLIRVGAGPDLRRPRRHPAFQPIEQQHDHSRHDHVDHRQLQERFVDDESILLHAFR